MGGSNAAGIGGGESGNGGNISIYGGSVIATGGDHGSSGDIVIEGYSVRITATGGSVNYDGGAGIGGGQGQGGGRIDISTTGEVYGTGTSEVAKHWRIRTGIEQPTTSLTTEVNLALALKHCNGVADVDFETVWSQGHEPVEREGASTENFMNWINSCVKTSAKE